MTKLQISSILGALLLFFTLYFGCDTKPDEYREVVKARMQNAQTTSVKSLLAAAKKNLPEPQFNAILALETQLKEVTSDSAKAELLKSLSGKWYEYKHPELAGSYALEVAELTNTEQAWSIAGTTFSICTQQANDEKIKAYCTEKAVQSFESAISINPDNPRHQLNLALLYTENPPKDNPMKGILMLLELNKQYPENVPVLLNLGRLAIQTGQFEKAIQRLEKVLSLSPENARAACLLSQAYDGMGDSERSTFFKNKCETLSE